MSGASHDLSERRSSPRLRVLLQARYSSAQLSLDGYVSDLSPDGCFFHSDLLDSRGERAELLVALPTETTPIALHGEVRWVSEDAYAGGMGIRLTGVSVRDRLLITAMLGGAGMALPLDATV